MTELDLGVEMPSPIAMNDPVQNPGPTPGFSGDWKDMAKDMQLLSQNTGIPIDEPVTPVVQEAPVSTPTTQPVTTEAPVTTPQPAQPPAATVTVPEKFQKPDGSLDQEKALNAYFEAEKGIKRAQQEVYNLKHGQTQQPVPVVATPEANTFEAQVYQDFVASGLDQRSAAALVPTITKLFAAASDAGYARAMGEVSQFKQSAEETRMKDELKAIVAIDPSLMTPDGIKTLVEIRQMQPWLNQSPEPWKAAWQVKIANESLKRSAGGGQVPTPTPKAVTVPSAPVTAAPMQAETVTLNDPEQIRNHLKTLTEDQKREFFKRSLGNKIKW